ncbi:hypothetical protein B0H14DRAFT_3907648 [Mycena olivaceomarginata]|nr:hypothetical protein B0H14DRAFT_3907648 [Mycena olivaceomarginata]
MHAVLKESNDRGLTTGAEREMRTKALGGEYEETGNAANAALAAAARDQRAKKSRRKLYGDVGAPQVAMLETARLTVVAPLIPLQWVLVSLDRRENPHQHEIYLAQVLAMFARGAGENGNHGGVLDGTKSISALSYLNVQVYAVDSTGIFSPLTQHMELIGCSTFAHVPSFQVLLKVTSPTFSSNGRAARLNDADFHLFTQFKAARHLISTAITSFRSKKKKNEGVNDDL